MAKEAGRILKEYFVGDVENDNDLYHIGKVLLATLKKYGDRINQIEVTTGESETSSSVLKRSIKCAIALKQIGLKKGDVVMLSSTMHLDSVIPFLAAAYIGAIAFPVDFSLKRVDVIYYLRMSKPKIIICDQTAILESIEGALDDLENLIPYIVLYGPNNGKLHASFNDFIISIPDSEIGNFQAIDLDPATTPVMILSTSGSTGVPKGVIIPHKSLLVPLMTVWFRDEYPYFKEIVVATSGLHWISGVFQALSSNILGAVKLQSALPMNPDIMSKIIKEYKPTLTLMNPAFALAFLAKEECKDTDWSSLRTLLVGGTSVGMHLLRTLKKKVYCGNVYVAYGSTETIGPLTFCLDQPNPESDIVSIGKSPPQKLLKIVDPSTEQELGPYQPGELYIKYELNTTGYYNNLDATTDAFTEDGWLKSGDILYYDNEGYYYCIDRIKSMMKYKANQVSSVEIENVVQTHPAVALVVVERYEVPPDDLAVALIIKKANAQVTADEIKDLVREQLAPFKQLHGGVFFVDSLPRLPSGKIDRLKSREIIKAWKISDKENSSFTL